VPTPEASVAALYRYPVKSMLGESLTAAALTPGGIVGDRAYALIDESDGKVASAKHPRKWGALLSLQACLVATPDASAATPPPVVITAPDGTQTRSDAPDVDDVLSRLVGRRVRLACVAPDDRAFEEVWPDIDGLAPEDFVAQTTIATTDEGEAVSNIPLGMFAPAGTFFDLSVVHFITTATLDTLRAAAPGSDFDEHRYRPNIVIECDDDGFPENDWVGQTITIGADAAITVTLPTMRCVMTTLAHGEVAADRTTLRAIAAHNRVEIAGFGTWACAGAYADVMSAGHIAVGDRVGTPPLLAS
jgi:uncharacterized protein YcbX